MRTQQHEQQVALSNLAQVHPELHHYTDLGGLKGIIGTNTLWATHFAYLNDTSEVILLQRPMINALLADAKISTEVYKNRNRHERRVMKKDKFVERILEGFVESMFETAFIRTKIFDPMAEAFILSFCAHLPDQSYEARNGLLSQWRAYGGGERYSIVFDTSGFITLLDRERQSHPWVYLDLDQVHYASSAAPIGTVFPGLIEPWVDENVRRIQGKASEISYDMIIQFLSAATRFKHQGFREEREVRVIAIPHPEAMAKKIIAHDINDTRTLKRVRLREERTQNIPYIALFESLDTPLPIRRIIVGPSRHQDNNFEEASKVVKGRFPLIRSETPYNG